MKYRAAFLKQTLNTHGYRLAPRLLALLFALLVLAGCVTSPTGRNQLMLFDQQQLAKMGDQSYAKLEQKTPIDHNSADNRFVKCVVQALTSVPGVQKATHGHWRFTVFKSKEINAFALPGGNIGVYSGILPVTQTGAQLAAVLGHEIGHVLAGHPNERLSEQYATQSGLGILGAVLGGGGGSVSSQALMQALGIGAQVGVLLPFSRAQESEADLIGLNLMARAGFDPRQAVTLWHNMSAASKGKEPNPFLSTHPTNANRIKHLKEHMDKALQLYRQAPSHPSCPHP
jgi:predicted Zn-dependent protease